MKNRVLQGTRRAALSLIAVLWAGCAVGAPLVSSLPVGPATAASGVAMNGGDLGQLDEPRGRALLLTGLAVVAFVVRRRLVR